MAAKVFPVFFPEFGREFEPYLNPFIMPIPFPHTVYQHPLLSPEAVRRVEEAHEAVFFRKNEPVLRAGQTAKEYHVLGKGLMRSYVYDPDGRDITTGFFTAPAVVVNSASLFQQQPSLEHFQTLTDCTCWRISLPVFQELFHELQGLREWGRAWMAGQLFEHRQRQVEMITQPALERYCQLLERQPDVVQYAPLKHVATYLGMTDSSLSRIRKSLAQSKR